MRFHPIFQFLLREIFLTKILFLSVFLGRTFVVWGKNKISWVLVLYWLEAEEEFVLFITDDSSLKFISDFFTFSLYRSLEFPRLTAGGWLLTNDNCGGVGREFFYYISDFTKEFGFFCFLTEKPFLEGELAYSTITDGFLKGLLGDIIGICLFVL